MEDKEPGQAAFVNDPPSNPNEGSRRAGLYKASRGRDMPGRSSGALSPSASGASQEDALSHLESNQALSRRAIDPAAPENPKAETQLPEMSVHKGISLKRLGDKFPREDLFMELKARDHVSEGHFFT